MLFTRIVGGIALLAASAAAHPLLEARALMSENPDLEISNLVVNDTSNGNTVLSFSVKNPEPLAAKDVAQCRGEWSHTYQDWPLKGRALRCDNSQTITWFIDSWTSARDFVVAVQDRFDDSTVGPEPFNRVTTFSRFVVNATSVLYDSPDLAADPVSGSQISEHTIYADVYAVIAK